MTKQKPSAKDGVHADTFIRACSGACDEGSV